MYSYKIIVILVLTLYTAHANVHSIMDLPPSYNDYFNGSKHAKSVTDPDAGLLLVPRKINELSIYDKMAPRYQKLAKDFAYLQIFSASFLGTLWLLPEGITNWNTEYIIRRGFGRIWLDNVTEPAVIDKDDWAINYIGHPIGGAYYYTLARNDGLSVWESSLFTFVVSTFYWEYGIEAMFERPSIQDLIITPLLGPLIGEGFYQLQLKIKANEGKVFGSTKLGSLSMILLNPEGALADFFQLHEDVIDFAFVSNFSSPFSLENDRRAITGSESFVVESYIGFSFRLKF